MPSGPQRSSGLLSFRLYEPWDHLHPTFPAHLLAWIHQRWPNLPIRACGGARPAPASRAMAELLREKSVPESLIWTEERSTSTYQKALFGAEILKPRDSPGCVSGGCQEHAARGGVLRQIGRFRGAGALFLQWGWNGDDLLPGWSAIRRNEDTQYWDWPGTGYVGGSDLAIFARNFGVVSRTGCLPALPRPLGSVIRNTSSDLRNGI
jgi:hypothetical protein